MSVSGFPNLFQMVGPNTGLGHNSIIFMIESQSRYIVDAIEHLKAKGAGYMDIREDIQREFNEGIQNKLVGTVWQTGCQSWYKRADGKNFTLWPGTTFRYRWETRKIQPDCYEWRISVHSNAESIEREALTES
ncbi:4-hydroxyacetophenone monooxygenase [Elysia marginata]|uniref:4-hydroxyacetophenone monooxygenase n=1 Tax=Elysia marginata TaxID=1093978 RepID=A0AAV4JUQ4_9GAST|nr:4-hydroxyacetophenone monooxygenase [Elysia marginata]